MSLKSKFIYVIVLVILIASLGIAAQRAIYFYQVSQRLSSNQTLLLEENNMLESSLHKFKLNDSINAARIQVLTLTVSELKNSFPKVIQELKDLQVPIRRVESITSSLLSSSSNITTPVKDTVIIRDSLKIPTISFSYQSEFLKINGYIVKSLTSPDSIKIQHKTYIPLDQVIYRVPRFRFLWINFGTKHLEQIIWTKNPDADIEYSRVIKLSKKNETF